MGFYQRYMEVEAVTARLDEINKAAKYLDRKRWERVNKRIKFAGLTAYVIAAGLVGWLMSQGVM